MRRGLGGHRSSLGPLGRGRRRGGCRGCRGRPEPSGGAELLAGQLTTPPTAVRVIWPAEPAPTLDVESCSVPGEAGAPPAPAPGGWAGVPFRAAGAWPGGSGWVAAVISPWPRPPAMPTSGGVASRDRADPWPAGTEDGPDGETGPAAPRPDAGRAGPVGAPSAVVGPLSPAAPGFPASPARAEAITTAEAIAPAPAISRPARRGRRPAGEGTWTAGEGTWTGAGRAHRGGWPGAAACQ